jgi:ribosomal protein S8
MTHTNLVANELQDSGFKVRVVKNIVEVSLDNRKINNMEVREALEQKFEGIEFNLTSTSNGVLVTV